MAQFIQCTPQGNNWEYRLGLGTIVKVDGQAEGRPVTTDCFRFRIRQDLGLPKHIRVNENVRHRIGHELFLHLVQAATEYKEPLILKTRLVSETAAIETFKASTQETDLHRLHEILHNLLQTKFSTRHKNEDQKQLVRRVLFVLDDLARKIAAMNVCHLVLEPRALDQREFLIHQPDSDFESLLSTVGEGPEGPDVGPSRSRSSSLVVEEENEGTPQQEPADVYSLQRSQTNWSPPASQSDSYGSPDNSQHKRMNPSSSSSSSSSKRSRHAEAVEAVEAVTVVNPVKEVKTINICVASSGRQDKVFKVKETTRMSKIYEAFAKHINCDVSDLCFKVFKQREMVIGSTQTPRTLGLEDGDVIECRLLDLLEPFFSSNINSESNSTMSSPLPRKV